MGGVRPSLRPRDSLSARGPGSQHSMAQIAAPGGRHPLPPGPQRTPMEMRFQTAPGVGKLLVNRAATGPEAFIDPPLRLVETTLDFTTVELW
jgi:hypothetical protein